MVFFNWATMQMAAKIVYYGPGLCGKTSNLSYIYAKTSPSSRGEMVSLETESDRTLFFDLLPIEVGTIGGFKTRLQLYTVPGQVFYNTTRKLVLKGVDGMVFVADSQRPMREANLESLASLNDNLGELGVDMADIPIVLQYNKRDLKQLLTLEELQEDLNPHGSFTYFMSSAINGEGVFETLKEITKQTLKKLRKRMAAPEQSATSRTTTSIRDVPGQAASESRPSVATAPAPTAPALASASPPPGPIFASALARAAEEGVDSFLGDGSPMPEDEGDLMDTYPDETMDGSAVAIMDEPGADGQDTLEDGLQDEVMHEIRFDGQELEAPGPADDWAASGDLDHLDQEAFGDADDAASGGSSTDPFQDEGRGFQDEGDGQDEASETLFWSEQDGLITDAPSVPAAEVVAAYGDAIGASADDVTRPMSMLSERDEVLDPLEQAAESIANTSGTESWDIGIEAPSQLAAEPEPMEAEPLEVGSTEVAPTEPEPIEPAAAAADFTFDQIEELEAPPAAAAADEAHKSIEPPVRSETDPDVRIEFDRSETTPEELAPPLKRVQVSNQMDILAELDGLRKAATMSGSARRSDTASDLDLDSLLSDRSNGSRELRRTIARALNSDIFQRMHALQLAIRIQDRQGETIHTLDPVLLHVTEASSLSKLSLQLTVDLENKQ